jgi:CHASE2 domain-containing sensor protein
VARDPLVLALLTAVTLGTVVWALREFRTARDGRRRTRERRIALYYALLLDSFGTAFTILLMARLWPGLPPQLALLGLAPALVAAVAVRFNTRFSTWMLDQLKG